MSGIVFGGFQPCSFIDFPGRVSAVLFTIGCNLRCPFCHNPQLVDGPTEVRIDEEEVLDYLDRRKGRWVRLSSAAASQPCTGSCPPS
jgi:pyruvate formate lyase activating enzyme